MRKAKRLSQADVGKLIGINGDTYGRYERDEVKPSIEMALKMALAFGVTVDFLLGQGQFANYDKETIDRINGIQNMDEPTKNILFNLIDTYIQNFETKQAFAK